MKWTGNPKATTSDIHPTISIRDGNTTDINKLVQTYLRVICEYDCYFCPVKAQNAFTHLSVQRVVLFLFRSIIHFCR